MQVLQHNLVSMFSQREFKAITGQRSKNTEKLSSGYRINRSADDAAGLSISEKMRWQVRGLDRASDNIQDGISFIQTGEGALDEVQSMLQRIRELSVQASNDTNTALDRYNIDKEVQQLKTGMNRIFSNTEFNTLKIFRAPYVPSIDDGELNDYELFDNGAGTPAAGIMVNNKRYTWEELGLSGTTAENDWEKKMTDDNGELIWLTLNKGEDVTKMVRHYLVEADDTGILVNKLYAGKWDGGTPPITEDGNTLRLQYHGLDLSFELDEEDDRDTVIDRINGDGLFDNGWKAAPIGGSAVKAVSSTADSIKFNVTNGNKNEIESWGYKILATNEGVQLKEINGRDGIDHTLMPWKNFTNTNGGESFPISDWGTENEGANPVTLDKSATYQYVDQAGGGAYTDKMKFKFNFNANEVSKAQTIAGLTQDLDGGAVSAPISSVTGSAGMTVNSYSGFGFQFQRDQLLRDFGSSGSSSPMNLNVERTMMKDGTVTDHEFRYELSKAYAKRNDDYTDTTVTTYTGIASRKFYDLDGTTEISEDQLAAGAQLDEALPVGSSSVTGSGRNTSYVENTGLSPTWTDTANSVPSNNEDTESVRREVKNGAGVVIAYEDIVFNRTVTVNRATNSSYETAGGKLVDYKKNGENYEAVSGSSYYVRGSGTDTDTDGNSYQEADPSDTSTQRYLRTGSAWIATNTYDLDHYTYSAKNGSGTEVLSKTTGTPQFLVTGGGSGSITIHDSAGHATSYYTEASSAVRSATLSGNGSSVSLSYENGVGNRTDAMTVTPDGPAARTFTKSSRTAGSATDTVLKLTVNAPEKLLHIQAGALEGQSIDLKWPSLSTSIIGISSARTTDFGKSQAAIDMVDDAISMISDVRSIFGATQNRLEYAYAIDQNNAENTQAAESRIRDTDMAKEMVDYSKNGILSQAGMAMITQANQQPQGILTLLS